MRGDDRLGKARSKLEEIQREVEALIRHHENNRFLNYSGVLVKQVGTSFAANAFIALQEASFYAELSAICRIWDNAKELDSSEQSIPAVSKLLDDGDVFRIVSSEFQGCARVRGLKWAISAQTRVSRSSRLNSVRNFRDKFIGHRLSVTRAETKAGMSGPMYGDEEWLLGRTLVIFSKLWNGLDIGTLDLKDDLARNRRCSELLWARTEFNIGG